MKCVSVTIYSDFIKTEVTKMMQKMQMAIKNGLCNASEKLWIPNCIIRQTDKQIPITHKRYTATHKKIMDLEN